MIVLGMRTMDVLGPLLMLKYFRDTTGVAYMEEQHANRFCRLKGSDRISFVCLSIREVKRFIIYNGGCLGSNKI